MKENKVSQGSKNPGQSLFPSFKISVYSSFTWHCSSKEPGYFRQCGSPPWRGLASLPTFSKFSSPKVAEKDEEDMPGKQYPAFPNPSPAKKDFSKSSKPFSFSRLGLTVVFTALLWLFLWEVSTDLSLHWPGIRGDKAGPWGGCGQMSICELFSFIQSNRLR